MSGNPIISIESISIAPSPIGYRAPTRTCGCIQNRTLHVISPRRTPSRSLFVNTMATAYSLPQVPTANAIGNWFFPIHNAIVTTKLILDKVGRIVLPKPLRDRLQLAPGDTLNLETKGENIILRPVRQNVLIKKELGVWVYQGEPTDASIPDLIGRDRENRNRTVTE